MLSKDFVSKKIDNESHYHVIIHAIIANVKKKRDNFSENHKNWVNYTHNFRECQKNLQKMSKFFNSLFLVAYALQRRIMPCTHSQRVRGYQDFLESVRTIPLH